MKNTQLKNWLGDSGGQISNRLVWMAGPEAPAQKETPKETLDTSKELPKDKLDALADRIKDLTLKNGEPIDIPKPPDALKLRAALKGQVEQIAKDLNIKNIDLYLLNGLLENIGKADKKPSQLSAGEMTDLTKWMKEGTQKVAKFTIDKGYWKFFDEKGTPVFADYKLDQSGKAAIDEQNSKITKIISAAPGGMPTADQQKEILAIIKAADPNVMTIIPSVRYKGDSQAFVNDLEQGKLTAADFDTMKFMAFARTVQEKAVISSDVQKKKTTDIVDKATDEKSETERLKPENLEKISAKSPVDLPTSSSVTVDYILGQLEFNLPHDAKNKPAITSAEMKVTLMKYIGDAQMPGANDDEKFGNFIKKLAESGLTQITVDKGKILFINKSKSTPDKIIGKSNPLDLQKPNGKGGFDKQNIYAHETLRVEAEKKQGAANKEVADKVTADENDKKDKPTKYDSTEKQIQDVLKPPGAEKLPNIDARYLPAFDAMLKYDITKNVPVSFNIPFNDKGLDCTMVRNAKGTFILKYGPDPKADMEWQPSKGSKDPVTEALRFFAGKMNSGEMLQKVQSFNIRSKANFAKFDIPIDNGPKERDGGKVEYELGWKTGAFEKDPHIFIESLPHGAIRVNVQKSDVGMNGEKEFNFVAGGFQDMTRVLRDLQQWHENPNKNDPGEKAAEGQRRYFAKGIEGLQGDIPGGLKTGKLLKVDSVGSTIDLKLTQGYYFRFDWMEKLDPPQKLQMVKDSKGFEVTMEPSHKILGHAMNDMPGGFADAMRMVAAQREMMMTTGGEKMAETNTNKLIADYNDKIGGKDRAVALSDKVKVVGFSTGANGQNLVYLSMDGMAGVPFDFTISKNGDKFSAPGIAEAARQGYLIRGNGEVLGAKVPEKGADGDKAPEKLPQGSNINVLRPAGEGPKIMPEAEAKIKDAVSKINPDKQEAVNNYLRTFFVGATKVASFDNILVSGLMNFAKIDGKYVTDKFGDKLKDAIPLLIKVINNPDSPEAKQAKQTVQEAWEKNLTVKYGEYPKSLNVMLAHAKILAYSISRVDSTQTIGGKSLYDDLDAKYEKAYDDKIADLKKNPDIKPQDLDKALVDYINKSLKNSATECVPEWNKTLDAQKKAPEKSADGSSGLNVLRSGEKPQVSPAADVKIKDVVSKITAAGAKTDIDNYLRIYLTGLTNDSLIDGAVASALREFAKVDKKYMTDKFGDNSKARTEYLIKVINNPNSKEAKDAIKATLEPWETYFAKKYDTYPKAFKLISANFKILRDAYLRNDSSKQKIGGKDFWDDYSAKMETAIDAKITELKAKPKVKAVEVDKDLADFVNKSIKNATTEGLPEWNAALDAQKAADAAKADADAKASADKNLLDVKANPNGMPFTDFDKQTMAGLGPDAFSILKASSIKPENIFLSKIPANSLVNTDRICVNIKAGPDNNQQPYTINFVKFNGATVIRIAAGWNNTDVVKTLSLRNDAPTPAGSPDKIAYLVEHFEGSRRNHLMDESGTPKKGPVTDSDDSVY